ncbi:hypothetical protein F5884DRAFT_307200 [Xylogone sp. PMI_703]|nr:hypothetical protein F5884DRAFT_307200 [Xylogone sp. PMI_703]
MAPKKEPAPFDNMVGPSVSRSGDGDQSNAGAGAGAGERRPGARPQAPVNFSNLEFVDMNATSQAERQRNKRVIRSTAMRSFRQKQKQQREMGQNESGGASSSASASKSSSAAKESQFAANIRTKPRESSASSSAFPIASSSISSSLIPASSSAATFSSTLAFRRGKNLGQSDVDIDIDDENNVADSTTPNDLALTPDEVLANDPWLQSSGDPSQLSFGHEGGFIIGEVDQGEGIATTSQTSSSILAASSPLTLVGQGRIDPFRINNVNADSHYHDLIDHSLSVVWPGFRVPGTNGQPSIQPRAWLERVYERPVVMHAMLFGAAVHRDVLRSPKVSLNNPVRLFHKVQTMKLLKEELKKSNNQSIDDLLLSVLTLGCNEVELVANVRGAALRSPFNSPMTSTQWLDVYGSISHIPAHTTAMRSLVEKKGGLEKVELNGLAEVIAFSDILGATQTINKPFWPMLARSIPTPEELPDFPPKTINKRFRDLLAFGINDAAAVILQSMADLTVIIENHVRGINSIKDFELYIRHRNTVQHRLMSLPRGEDLEYGEVSSVCLYESIRHTAVIYSAAVTFAIPPHSGIFRTLAARLKSIMEESKFDPCWQLCPETLLWMLVLGGVAATGTADRGWYVQNLAAVSSALKLSEWEDVEDGLKEFLWLSSACEPGGRLLWMEVMNDRLVQEHSSGAERLEQF